MLDMIRDVSPTPCGVDAKKKCCGVRCAPPASMQKKPALRAPDLTAPWHCAAEYNLMQITDVIIEGAYAYGSGCLHIWVASVTAERVTFRHCEVRAAPFSASLHAPRRAVSAARESACHSHARRAIRISGAAQPPLGQGPEARPAWCHGCLPHPHSCCAHTELERKACS